MHAHAHPAITSRPARRSSGVGSVARRAFILASWCAAPVLLIPPSEPVFGSLATGAGFVIGTAAWLASDRSASLPVRAPAPVGILVLARHAFIVYAATLLLAIAVGLPILLVLWPLDQMLGASAVVAGVLAALPWAMFALPGIVDGDDPSTAFDRSVAWVGTAPARTAAGLAACLVASLGPAIVAAVVTGSVGWPLVAQRAAILAALAVTGGTLAAWMGPWARRLDERRRRRDPWFTRP